MRHFRLAFFLLAVLPLTGCLFRTHRVEQRAVATNLKEATLSQLVEIINAQSQQIRTLNATVDIAAAVGGPRLGKITEYQEIRGYILVRRPEELRFIGLFPVVRNRAFDMVSKGEIFRVSIPAKNRFYIGHDTGELTLVGKPSLENLRPHVLLDALLLHPMDPENEIAFLEQGAETVRAATSKKKEVEQPTYIVTILHRDGGWHLERRVIFSRADLLPHRQVIYDKKGEVATEARYEDFQSFDGVQFPTAIQVNRPQDEYQVQFNVVKLRLNQPMTDEQFALAQPPGSVLVNLDEKRQQSAADPSSARVPAQ